MEDSSSEMQDEVGGGKVGSCLKNFYRIVSGRAKPGFRVLVSQ